jgi:hypothetical protein
VVPARAHAPCYNSAASFNFIKNLEELASSRTSITRQALPSPRNYPNVSSGVIGRSRSSGRQAPPPIPLEKLTNQIYFGIFLDSETTNMQQSDTEC